MKLVYAFASFASGLLLCVALVLHLQVRTGDWVRLLNGLSWPWVLVVTVLTVLLWWSGARKWALWSLALHGEAGGEPSSGFFFRNFAWQNWAGQFVPPPLAIILGRGWATRHMPGVSMRAGAGNATLDQALEFLLLAGFLPAAVLVLHQHASWIVWGPVAGLGMAGVASAVWFFRSRLPIGSNAFLLPILGWSAGRVLLTVTRLVVCAPALGLAIDPSSIMAAAPVVALLALIPLTPGNLGIAEWGWAGVLTYAGASPVDASLLAVGARLLLLVVQSLLIVGVSYQGKQKADTL
jgi:hypothetical protein